MDKIRPKSKYSRRFVLKFLSIFEKDLRNFSEFDMAEIGSGLLIFNVFMSIILQRKTHRYLHFTSKIIDSEKLIIEGKENTEFRKSLASSPGVYLQCHNKIIVDCSVLLGPGVRIISANHDLDNDRNDHYESKPIKIDAGVWLSANVIVLPGVDIRKNSVIGAGSVVLRDVQSDSLVSGNPAKLIRFLSDEIN